MRIIPCPICGNMPKIIEGNSFKDGTRRRLCGCPHYCSVIPENDRLYHSRFIYCGDGDANAIFRIWNRAIEMYERVKDDGWQSKNDIFWSNDDINHKDRWW